MLKTIERFEKWLALGQCVIRSTTSRLIRLTPNVTQQIIIAAMKRQASKNKPIRLVILKARKRGVTTIIEAFQWFSCAYKRNQVALMLAHQADSTREIFEAAKLISRNHKIVETAIGNQSIYFEASQSRFGCHTAGGHDIGAGGTPSHLHLSEVALYKLNKETTLYSSTQAVPFVSDTMIVQESTARGREQFWDLFVASYEPDHPYFPIFIPWFFGGDCAIDTLPLKQLDDDECILKRLAKKRYGLTLTHRELAWRRMKIREIGEDLFRQEYPATPEEAVRSRRGLVLSNMSECIIDGLPFNYGNVSVDERVGGYDYGYSDPTALVSGIYRDQILYVIRVFRDSKRLSLDYAAEAMDGHTYYCDPANPGAREQLAKDARLIGKHCLFVQAPRSNDGTDKSVTKQEWDLLRRMMIEGRILIVQGAHEQLITEADSFEWNPTTGEPDKRRTPECGHFDTLDALRYMAMGAIRGGHVSMPIRETSPSRRESLRSW